MIRNRLVATVLLTLGTSMAAVVAADPPPVALPEPGQPRERVIKIEIGFEPGPLEESPVAAPTVNATQSPEPPSAPIAVPIPAPVAAPPVVAPTLPPPAPIDTSDSPKLTPLSLAALERMALSRVYAQLQTPKTRGPIIQAGSWAEKSGPVALEGTGLPQDFVDKIVPALAPAGSQSKPLSSEMLARQYRLLNGVRLRYYHLLALQKLMAVREDLASVSRDAVTAIEAMAAAGQASKAELLQARVEAREQLAALQNVRAIHQAVWRRMAVTIGQPDLPVGPLAGDLEQCCAMPGFEAAWAHVLEANPDLLIARGEVARRQATLRQSLSGSTCKSGNCDKAASDGLIGQAMSLFGGTNPTHDPQVKQAAWTDLSQWEAEVGRIEQSLKQKLADAYARHERAKEVTDLYYMQNLPDAKEAFELSVIGYRQGRGSWPQVQIAQRNYFRMSTEYVEALAELRRAELVVLGLLMDAPEESTTQTAQK